eukprot:CAMPEP_0175430962 /NCGR_PEP_ID=MMETSP0095-20121207/52131_1 /TAXON_ID=311494 /ORGANISM="Alexandrium monilatum, Strain CCMP3105" /LENGTH=59 /DNA_ID=CAMNT_0016730433 /DNA_START=1 /DNA_END=180 /DNA_ORIENTATION=+
MGDSRRPSAARVTRRYAVSDAELRAYTALAECSPPRRRKKNVGDEGRRPCSPAGAQLKK